MSPESQKIKILAMKLSSLRTELDTAKDVANAAALEVDRLYYEQHSSKEVKQEPEQEKIKHSNQQIPEDLPERHPVKETTSNPDTKSAFRKIALKIHPDKLEGLPPGAEKEEKINLYQKATKAMEEEDLVMLAAIAIDLGLDPPEVPDEYIKKATDEISTIKEQINHIESTYVWKWLFCSDKQQKKELLEKMFKLIYERNENKNPGS